jgi:hypothetical protein
MPGDHAAALERLRGISIELLIREDITMSSAPVAGEVLEGLGFPVRLVSEDAVDLSPGKLVLAAGATRSYRRTLERIEALPAERRPLVVVWHTEPLPMPRACGVRRQPLTVREVGKIVLRDRRVNDHYSNARFLRGLARAGFVDALVVAAKAYQVALAEEGIDVHHVPLGYHPYQGRLLDSERDVGVLFLGETRMRRRQRILRRLRSEGVEVTVLGDYADPDLWGESRTALLNRTKIMLHIPRLEGHTSDIRMNISMACGALLVSEPLCFPDPFVPGTHHVEAPLDELAATISRYLENEPERRRIAEQAHAFLTGDLTLDRTFAQLLALTA